MWATPIFWEQGSDIMISKIAYSGFYNINVFFYILGFASSRLLLTICRLGICAVRSSGWQWPLNLTAWFPSLAICTRLATTHMENIFFELLGQWLYELNWLLSQHNMDYLGARSATLYPLDIRAMPEIQNQSRCTRWRVHWRPPGFPPIVHWTSL